MRPRRRERNRASALEAYYRGKARRTELEAQLRALREEDAALNALSALTQADDSAGGAPLHTVEHNTYFDDGASYRIGTLC